MIIATVTPTALVSTETNGWVLTFQGKSNVAGKSLAVNGWEVMLGGILQPWRWLPCRLIHYWVFSMAGNSPILNWFRDSQAVNWPGKKIRLEFLGTEVVFWVGKMARHLSALWAEAVGSMLLPLVAVHMYLWKWVYSISRCVGVCVYLINIQHILV